MRFADGPGFGPRDPTLGLASHPEIEVAEVSALTNLKALWFQHAHPLFGDHRGSSAFPP
jgi:hypothetical protein